MNQIKIGDKVSTTYSNIANRTGEVTAIYKTAATIRSETGFSHHKISRLEVVK